MIDRALHVLMAVLSVILIALLVYQEYGRMFRPDHPKLPTSDVCTARSIV